MRRGENQERLGNAMDRKCEAVLPNAEFGGQEGPEDLADRADALVQSLRELHDTVFALRNEVSRRILFLMAKSDSSSTYPH